MTDPTNADLRRELRKAADALAAARTHLARHAEMNAALHCSDRVMYSPLHARVDAALVTLDHHRAVGRMLDAEEAAARDRMAAPVDGDTG